MFRKVDAQDIANWVIAILMITLVCWYAWNGSDFAVGLMGAMLALSVTAVTFFRQRP